MTGVIKAIGHVRRAPLDRRRPGGYSAAVLEDLEPLEIAAYVAALRLLDHEDQSQAGDLLEAKGGGGFEDLIDNVISRLRGI